MTACRCPVCGGETFEIRAKVLCRRCGIILETCCEGGPMGSGATGAAAPPREPAPPDDPPAA